MVLKWCVRLTPKRPQLLLKPFVEATRGKYDQLQPLQELAEILLDQAISEADQSHPDFSLKSQFKQKPT